MKDNSSTRIELLKAYIAEDPNDPFMHYALALEYVGLNKNEDALTLLENLVNQHPDYLPSYYQLGKLYEQKARYEDSLKTYTKGIAIAKQQNDFHTLSELQSAYDMLEQ